MFFSKLLLYLDIFGVDFVFLTNDKEKNKTAIGVVLTLLYFIILVFLFLQFGVDLYERKNPKVSTNLEVLPYTAIKLSNKNFTFAYRVEDENGNIFLDETVIFPKLYYIYFVSNNGVWNKISERTPKNRRCNDFPDYKEKEAFYGISLASWYCVDFDNFTWGGNWDGNFVNFFQVNIEQCINSTENQNHCATPERMSETFIHERSSGNLFYSQLLLSAQPAMDDYEQPLKTSLVNTYSLLSMYASKRKVQTFKTTALLQDIGWFWKHLRYEEVLELDTSEPDFTFKDQWKEGIVFSTYNYLGGKKQVYNRTYTKIQEVIANIGGFAKFSYTCIAFVYIYIKSTYRHFFLMENFSNCNQLIKESIVCNNDKTDIVIDDNFSYLDYLCIKLCRSRSPKRMKNYQTFMLMQSYFQEKMNIVSYFKLFYQVGLLSRAPVLAEYFNDAVKIKKLNLSRVNSSQKKILVDSEVKLQTDLLKLRYTKK